MRSHRPTSHCFSLPSAKGFGSKLDSEISGDVTKSGKKQGISFGKVFAIGAGLGLGAKAFSFLGDSLGEGREAQKVSALVANAIKATGGAANVTAGQVDRLATSISKKTGIDDEQIATASSLILTFKNVANEAGKGNDVFNRTTKAAVDLSAAGFGSVDSAAKQLGKALNDPIKGMSALSRSGVTFSEGQQEQIKGFVETGNLLKAQKLILAEVNSQVGGAAAATATASDKAAVSMGNLKEQIGTALLPVVDSLANTFTTKLAPGISSFITGMQTGTGAGGRFVATVTTARDALMSTVGFVNQHKTALTALAATIGAVVVVTKLHTAAMAVQAAGGLAAMIKSLPIITSLTKAWAAGQWLLNAALTANPIGLIVAGLIALGVGLVVAYKKSATFRKIVDAAFAAVKASAMVVVGFFTKSVPAAFGKVSAAASKVLGFVKSNWPAILAILTGPFGIAALLIVKNWDKIKAGGQAVLDFIKGMPDKIKAFFSGAASMLLTVGSQIIDGLTSGIRNAAGRVMSAVDSIINAIPAKIRKLMGIASPSKVTTKIGEQIMDGLTMGFGKGGKKMQERLTAHVDKIKETFTTLKSDMASLAQSVANAFNPDMFGLGGKDAVTEEVNGIVKVLEPATTALQEFMGGLSGNNSNLTAMLAAFDQLKAAGASKGFLSGLLQSGNTALATQLATAGPAAVKAASALFDENASLADSLGNKVAVGEYGEEIRNEMKALNKAMDDAPKKYAKELKGVLNGLELVVSGSDAGQKAYMRTGRR